MDSMERYTAFANDVRADAELLVKLTLIFQDIVEKENSKHNLSPSQGEVVNTTPVNMTTSDGATITGSVTTTNEHGTSGNVLTVTPLDVQRKLDSLDEQARVLGNPPIDKKELV